MLCNKICHEVGIAEIREREIMAVPDLLQGVRYTIRLRGNGAVLSKGGQAEHKEEHTGFGWKLAVGDMCGFVHTPILPVRCVVPNTSMNAGKWGASRLQLKCESTHN
jgi:hypothetical protein